MTDLLRYIDYQGREVTLSEQWWNKHVVESRPYLKDLHAYVQLVLANPYRVLRDARHASRECFYRHRTLPGEYHHLYFKVVVQYRRTGLSGLLVGTVVTAFPTPRIKAKEQPIWP